METVLALLGSALFVALIVGLIKPFWVLRWSKKPTRLKVIGWWFLATFVVSVLGAIITPEKTSESIMEQNRIEQEAAKEDSIRETQRKDSISFYISEAEQYKNKSNFSSAISSYQKALAFAPENSNEIKYIISNLLYQSKKYSEAIDSYSGLDNVNWGDTINYQIALCYIALSDKANAVIYLKNAMDKNSERAAKLYNKINPIKKKFIGYCTLCRDGSTSNNRGRGACSRHGGVANWNYPIYEEYREY